MTIKGCIYVEGLPTTCGVPARAGVVGTVDAHNVGPLRAAGVVIMGQTNTSMNALDWQSTNPLFGASNNPGI